MKVIGGRVYDTRYGDVADLRTLHGKETYYGTPAGRKRQHIADFNIPDALLPLGPVIPQNMHGFKFTAFPYLLPGSDGCQRNDIVARVSRYIKNSYIMTAGPEIDSVLVFHIVLSTVDDALLRGAEVYMTDIPE